MAYISTSHSVGSVVYAYDASTDSVRRLLIIGITAESTNASLYSGDWKITYSAVPACPDSTGSHIVTTWAGEQLHGYPRDAFPERAIPLAPEVTELEAA